MADYEPISGHPDDLTPEQLAYNLGLALGIPPRAQGPGLRTLAVAMQAVPPNDPRRQRVGAVIQRSVEVLENCAEWDFDTADRMSAELLRELLNLCC